jgi:hypothetical protein
MENVPAGTEREILEKEMPAGIERRLVLRLLGHWRSLCDDNKLPLFADIDAAAIPDIWPHSFLLEIDPREGGASFRALGDQIDKHPSGSLVGMRISDAPADVLPGLVLTYVDEVLEKGVPISRGGVFSNPDGTRVLFRSILLPIGDEANNICGILGAANCREVVDF